MLVMLEVSVAFVGMGVVMIVVAMSVVLLLQWG